MLVKFGTHVSIHEGEATQFVARRTAVRVPKIYAILRDESRPDGEPVTYIVQEKLPGETLMSILPTLSPALRDTIASELGQILIQLAALDTSGSLGHFGSPHTYDRGIFRKFHEHYAREITTPKEFLLWLPDILRAVHNMDPPPSFALDKFDLTLPPIFSHGDLAPENILIADGHVSGVVDWAYAGWYPYFWNDYIARARTNLLMFRDGKWADMVGKITPSFPEETKAFEILYHTADMFL
ncbi:kinase-like domain-containing protein [Mycena filopes]|nr:kinase-like domain-containing protein [Mycena filopes]